MKLIQETEESWGMRMTVKQLCSLVSQLQVKVQVLSGVRIPIFYTRAQIPKQFVWF